MRRLVLLCVWAVLASAQGQPDPTLKKVCGTCHAVDRVTGERRTRAQWQESIDKMVSLGAKATPEEFAKVLDILAKNYAPSTSNAPIQINIPAARPKNRPGADDKHVVDPAAADRGAKIWAVDCANCHGVDARGAAGGINLVRSEIVMHDRYSNELGPFLRQGAGHVPAKLDAMQIADLSHFLHQRLYDTLRGSPIFHEQSILTGDAAAGAAYFNGEGKCNTCHSPSGDLAGIARKYDAIAMQHRFLNPRPFGGRAVSTAKRVTLTVTAPGSQPVTGVPTVFDDFSVSVRDEAGDYHSWKRTADLKIVKNDPYAAHDELLEKYTDKNMHDIVAYLVTLK